MTATPTHTRESIEAMPARELDALVAEVVFGHRWYDCTNGVDYSWCSRLLHPSEAVAQWNKLVDRPSYDVVGTPRAYSTTWEGFGAVYGKVHEIGFNVQLFTNLAGNAALSIVKLRDRDPKDYPWHYDFDGYKGPVTQASDMPLPRAACIAAILAVQGGGA